MVLCSKQSLNISLQSTHVGQHIDFYKWPHLSSLDVPLTDSKNVNVLIGVGAPSVHWQLETCNSAEDELVSKVERF